MKHLYGKNRPAQAGIPVAETGIPPRRDGTKNVPPPYKQYVIKTIETYACRDPGHRPVPVNVPSRLSYKQAPRACLYERRDGTFAGTGRCLGSRHAYYVSTVFIAYCLYGGGTFFVPYRLGGIPVSATEIPA